MAQEEKELELQRKIVEAIEQKKDTSGLFKELKEVRDTLSQKKEMEELRLIADDRKVLKDKATKIIEKVALQKQSMEVFLKARDELLKTLEPLLPKVKALYMISRKNWDREKGIFPYDYSQNFLDETNAIPVSYLPDSLQCPFIFEQMKGGTESAEGKTEECLRFFSYVIGILTNFEVSMHTPMQMKTAEGLMNVGEKKVSK